MSENLKQLICIYGQRRYELGAAHGTGSNVLAVRALNEVDAALDQQATALEAAQRENARLRAALADIERHTRQETLPPSKAETVIKVANIVARQALQGGEGE